MAEYQTGPQPEAGGQPSTIDRAKQAVGSAREQARSAVNTAQQKAGETTEQATAKVDEGMERAAGGIEHLAGTLRHQGQATGGSTMQSAATATADKLEAGAKLLHSKDTDQLVADLESLIRRRPVESLLVAAGLGFVLAKAMR